MAHNFYSIYRYDKVANAPHGTQTVVDSYCTLEAAMDGWSTVLQFHKAVCDYYNKFLDIPGVFATSYRMYADTIDDKGNLADRQMVAECEVLPIRNE